ncbi:TRF2-interacting telomeric protein/Rap1 - C terminal domain containing protein [Elaphomyces granulatus]|jgi:telomeric repeat-binding factor 2-interacting protein 1
MPIEKVVSGTLFEGKNFWLSQTVPQRNRFKELIQGNGGTVVQREILADIKLVDHTKRDLPPDTYSYQYVERSIRNNKLESLEAHRAGESSKVARPVGAHTSTRKHRTAFSLEDDKILWDWMQTYEENGVAIGGNLPYQSLAEKHPSHTYQSWRDRYLKRLRGLPRPGSPPSTAKNKTAAQQETDQGTAVEGSSLEQANTTLPPAQPKATHPEVTQPSISRPTNVGKRGRDSADDNPGGANPKSTQQEDRKRKFTISQLKIYSSASNELSKDDKHEATRDSASDDVNTDVFETAPQSQISRKGSTSHTRTTNRLMSKAEENRGTLIGPPAPKPKPEPAIDESEGSPKDKIARKAGQDIDEWIDVRLRTGKAKSEKQILDVLRCTTMDPGLADQVLDYLASGRSIPQNRRGVWTAEDDRALEGTDARDIERVLKKHGPDLYNARFEYLEMIRAANLKLNQSKLRG